VWDRLIRKQYLFLYPLVLGVLNTLAFMAVFVSLEQRLTFSEFARANFARWEYLQEHAGVIIRPGLPLIVAMIAGLGVCLLAAALRAPFFRAIVGPGYPRAPRSGGELVRLSAFYLVTYLIFYVLPHSFPSESTAFSSAVYALIPMAFLFFLFVMAILLIFGDYACVFERVGPIGAIRSSIRLLKRAWPAAILVFVLATLLSMLVASIYGSYFEGAATVFPLLPVSQLLLEALLVVVIDTLLVSLYEYYRTR
jgi:hypothetical protein